MHRFSDSPILRLASNPISPHIAMASERLFCNVPVSFGDGPDEIFVLRGETDMNPIVTCKNPVYGQPGIDRTTSASA